MKHHEELERKARRREMQGPHAHIYSVCSVFYRDGDVPSTAFLGGAVGLRSQAKWPGLSSTLIFVSVDAKMLHGWSPLHLLYTLSTELSK
jgi:hypothetical protein